LARSNPRAARRLSHTFIHSHTLPSFVVFNNLSLQYNSVGFYQLMKVLTTPVVVVLQNFMYGVDLPAQLKLALVPVCLGVALATVNDFSFNPVRPFYPSVRPSVRPSVPIHQTPHI